MERAADEVGAVAGAAVAHRWQLGLVPSVRARAADGAVRLAPECTRSMGVAQRVLVPDSGSSGIGPAGRERTEERAAAPGRVQSPRASAAAVMAQAADSASFAVRFGCHCENGFRSNARHLHRRSQ